MVRAIALLSGGLDSTLAIKVVLEMGIAVEAVNFITPFCTCSPKGNGCHISKRVARNLGISLSTENVSREYLSVVKSPRYGYGKNMNPCLDCRIFMFKRAAEYMRSRGASFIVTGEVLGERPMSQRRDAMSLIERDAGLKGLVVRPLSAKLLPATMPEKEGWIDRGRLLSIQGRSRKPQLALASQWDISEYACPAGGCLLTDPGFAKRLKDLMCATRDFTLSDIHLLKIGRHFRISPKTKVIVGRNERENEKLKTFAEKGDWLIRNHDSLGPVTVVRGEADASCRRTAASLTASYGKERDSDLVRMKTDQIDGSKSETFMVKPYTKEEITRYLI